MDNTNQASHSEWRLIGSIDMNSNNTNNNQTWLVIDHNNLVSATFSTYDSDTNNTMACWYANANCPMGEVWLVERADTVLL